MDYSEIKEKMDKTISVYTENLSEIRAGRANPAILNKIRVDYYGVPTPISQVAGISVPEARQLLIKPFDRSCLGAIEKAILASNLGYKDKVTHASTGGGATLEYMEGKELPGVACIPEA